MVRESLYRGGDKGVVLTDRPLGGADTLATSYSLAQAIKHMGKVDIIIGGRQAIDGDTAQVGPQIAEKLGLPQVTYAEKLTVADGVATIKRRVERGFETVQCPLPLVVTVNGSADACRPRNARLIQKYKYAVSPSEKANLSEKMQALVDARPYLNITEWGVKDIEADPEQIGLKGSPTKVKTVVNVVFQAKESKRMDGNNDAELEGLVKELIADHIIG
jgi:electron transfer flavoprotein beta subunit